MKTGRDLFNQLYKNINKNEAEDLRRTLAKRANQRLVRLERSSSNITGEGYATYGAAPIAYSYISEKYPGKKRFPEKKDFNGSYANLVNEILELSSFLESKSSTVAGQRAIEKKRVETFQSGKWGPAYKVGGGAERKSIASATNKEFYDFLNSSYFTKLKSLGFTSEQIIEMYDSSIEKGISDDIIYEKLDRAFEDWKNSESTATISELIEKLGIEPIV